MTQWEPFEITISRQCLLWLGHVARMSKDRLPKKALFGFKQENFIRRNPPFRQGSWLRHLLAQIQLSELDWYRVAQDRQAWQNAVLNVFPTYTMERNRDIILNRWKLADGKPALPPARFVHSRRAKTRGHKKDPVAGNFHCPVCSTQFPKMQALRAHYDNMHGVSDPDKITLPIYTCDKCGQVWRQEKMRRMHRCPMDPRPKRAPKVHPQVQCSLCFQTMAAPNLGRHEAECRGPGLANMTSRTNNAGLEGKSPPRQTEGLRLQQPPRTAWDVRYKGEQETVRHVGGILQEQGGHQRDTSVKKTKAYVKLDKQRGLGTSEKRHPVTQSLTACALKL